MHLFQTTDKKNRKKENPDKRIKNRRHIGRQTKQIARWKEMRDRK